MRLRRRERPSFLARVRSGPPTPDSLATYEVVIHEGQLAGVLATFGARERKNAQDFANGFNCGVNWRPSKRVAS